MPVHLRPGEHGLGRELGPGALNLPDGVPARVFLLQALHDGNCGSNQQRQHPGHELPGGCLGKRAAHSDGACGVIPRSPGRLPGCLREDWRDLLGTTPTLTCVKGNACPEEPHVIEWVSAELGSAIQVRSVFELLPPVPVLLQAVNGSNAFTRATELLALVPEPARPQMQLLVGNPSMPGGHSVSRKPSPNASGSPRCVPIGAPEVVARP